MNGAVYSMTGFAIAKHPSGISIDIRSVNSRFLDLSFKLPDAYKHLEGKLREILTSQIRRGKCEVRISVLPAVPPAMGTAQPILFDTEGVKALLAQQASIHALAPSA
jgi:uncharacterized protein (TIGR00255 family)